MRHAPWAFAAPWGARDYVSDLDGPVHWIEFGVDDASTRARQTPIVFVHGLGGSHLNWCLVGPKLAEDRRAVALDLHGFGLTPGGRFTSTVQRNARLLDLFVREVTGTPILPGVGHTPQLEVPDNVIGTLRDWLGQHFSS
jgi:pimeloyl-ACP methyl ester carboxylesterase